MAYEVKQRAGNGQFFVEFRDQDGTRKRLSLGTRDRKQAEELARTKYIDHLRGVGTEATKEEAVARTTSLTLQGAFDRMLREDWHHTKVKTSRNILSDTKIIGGILGHKAVEDLIYDDFKEFERICRERGHAVGTIKRRLGRISVVLNKCAKVWTDPKTKRFYLDRVPAFPSVGKSNVRQRDLSEEDERRVLAYCQERAERTQRGHQWWLFRQFIIWQIDTGMRKSETLKVDASRIKDGCVQLYEGETKNGDGRAIPLTTRLREMVELFDKMGIAGRFFGSLTPGKIQEMWDVVRRDLNLGDIVIHDLRHTRGQRLDDADVPIEVIAELLGHKDIRVTQRVYRRAKIERLKRWVDAVDQGSDEVRKLRLVS